MLDLCVCNLVGIILVLTSGEMQTRSMALVKFFHTHHFPNKKKNPLLCSLDTGWRDQTAKSDCACLFFPTKAYMSLAGIPV